MKDDPFGLAHKLIEEARQLYVDLEKARLGLERLNNDAELSYPLAGQHLEEQRMHMKAHLCMLHVRIEALLDHALLGVLIPKGRGE